MSAMSTLEPRSGTIGVDPASYGCTYLAQVLNPERLGLLSGLMHTAGSSSRVHRDRIVSDGGVEHGPEDEFGLALAVHALLAQPHQEAVQPACGGFAQLEPAEAGQHEAVQHSAVLVDR